jgi:hypothetical protein
MIRLVLIFVLLDAFSFGIAGQGAAGIGGGGVGVPPTALFGGTPVDAAQLRDLDRRIFALESAKQDLSAWASIFIGGITLLALANVGLSVWQVGSIARNEVGKAVTSYDQKFSGFLIREERDMAERFSNFEAAITEMAKQRESISILLSEYSSEASQSATEAGRIAAAAVARLRNEGERLRGELRAEFLHSKD